MFKKIILITIFLLFAGVLVAGAINRTTDKSNTYTHTNNQGQVLAKDGAEESHGSQDSLEQQTGYRGQGQRAGTGGPQDGSSTDSAAWQRGQGGQGQGARGGQQGANGSANGGQGQGWRSQQSQQENPPETLAQVTLEGFVLQAPAAGVDLILESEEGEILIGTGPGYLDEQGFAIAVGDSLIVTGSWENEEFKAMEITHLTNGETITLRDEWGRPMWSGGARNAQNRNRAEG